MKILVLTRLQRRLGAADCRNSRRPPSVFGFSRNFLTSAILTTNVQADAHIGPAYLIPAYEGSFRSSRQICRMTRGADHEDAFRLGSQFMEFCGWLYQDSGDYRSAMYWTDRALEYAVELDDRRVISYVLMRKSNIATDAGQPGHGLGLAEAALKQPHRLTPRLRAVALRQRANANAMLHEPAGFAQDTEEAFIQATAGIVRTKTISRRTARRHTWRWRQVLPGSSSAVLPQQYRSSRTAAPAGAQLIRYVIMCCAWPG